MTYDVILAAVGEKISSNGIIIRKSEKTNRSVSLQKAGPFKTPPFTMAEEPSFCDDQDTFPCTASPQQAVSFSIAAGGLGLVWTIFLMKKVRFFFQQFVFATCIGICSIRILWNSVANTCLQMNERFNVCDRSKNESHDFLFLSKNDLDGHSGIKV